ncbi:MAG TPA: hypothetical protein VKZ95_04715 [Sphingobacteriaceae bacterium]|nr:hypothetical protein [Sphingobacteriaceae bacterium]
MPRELLVAEARAAGQAAKKNLAWMDKHPERYDQTKANNMREYLHMLIKFSENEQKNTRSAKRALVLSSFKGFIVSIIPQSVRRVVAK